MPSRRLVWLCALWSAVDAGCSATAQELRPEATKPAVVAEVGPEMTVYPGRYREADGHWSAVRGGGRADSDLRVNVWQLLAQLGDGSTLRSGPRRQMVKDVVMWLLAEQDDRGRIRLLTDPDWLLDHAMATFALAEAMRSSSCAWLGAPVRAAPMNLAEHIVVVRPPPGPELRLWCELLATSLLRIEALSDERGPRHFEVGAAGAFDFPSRSEPIIREPDADVPHVRTCGWSGRANSLAYPACASGWKWLGGDELRWPI